MLTNLLVLLIVTMSIIGLVVIGTCVRRNRRRTRRALRPLDLAWAAAPPSATFLAARAAFQCYVEDVARLSHVGGSS